MHVNNNLNDKFVQTNKLITHIESSDSYKKTKLFRNNVAKH